MATIKQVAPSEIEARSFDIITQEFSDRTGIDPAEIDPDRFQVIRRVIHATGDFDFARSLLFHEESIRSGINSIRSGRDICIDVSMGAAGINQSLLKSFGGSVLCYINDPEVTEKARKNKKTRTETAVEKLAGQEVGIVAVGNAPTALVATMDMIKAGKLAPDLVIGVPVGFVNAEESKDILADKNYPFITNRGRKGGTPVAVAILNALLRLAKE